MLAVTKSCGTVDDIGVSERHPDSLEEDRDLIGSVGYMIFGWNMFFELEEFSRMVMRKI